ncbi:hypothetical protein CVT26_000739 [Gymnopilus dilepis]|uniref:Transmembrane protein n=1 Tax=Gymnopilus dilepis TaxID=231916 RepID=A0A409Y2F3_9AGAR|nr:hypothetical protein CVT26_000739 [Gymnopilus dilepis]
MSAPPSPSLPAILDPSHPLAYLAYLPPSLAYELTVSVYILVAAVAVQIWDICNNVKEDYQLLVKRPFSVPGAVYCISRISTLVYLLYGITFETAPIGNCEMFANISPWIYCIALPSTNLLFFFRVRAMYDNNKYVSAFFFLLWLCVLAGSAVTVIGVAGHRIGPTKHCLGGSLRPVVSMSAIIQLVNDSLIFVAISIRLLQVGMVEEMGAKGIFKAVCSSKDLPAFTRALMRDGQVYYLPCSLTRSNKTFSSATCSALIVLITFYMESIPLPYRLSLSMGNLPVINIMACRVYRRTKSGKYRETSMPNLTLPITFLRESRTETSTDAA